MTDEQKQERMVDKLKKVLALTNSPVEGEAQAAALLLQELLTKYNLSVADLEKGGYAAPGVKEEGHDLAKAAFAWKLELAEEIADHYYCYGMVNRTTKTVRFVGRPENVDALKMLYAWVIDQIRRIASEERVKHIERTGEHIDPLRWQLNFGLGAVRRLSDRLAEIRERSVEKSTALVLHHRTEISDYLEEKYGQRVDGKKTKRQMSWEEEMAKQRVEDEELLRVDPVTYYNKYPWRHPAAVAEANAKYEKAAKRRSGARRARVVSAAEEKRQDQAWTASVAGRKAADRVNLQPFLEGGKGKGGDDAKLKG